MCCVLRLHLGPSCSSGGSWAHTCMRPPSTQPPRPVCARAPVLPHPGPPWLPAKASMEPHLPSSLLLSLPETVPGSLLWLRVTGTQAAGNSNNQRAEIKGPDLPPSPRAVPSANTLSVRPHRSSGDTLLGRQTDQCSQTHLLEQEMVIWSGGEETARWPRI